MKFFAGQFPSNRSAHFRVYETRENEREPARRRSLVLCTSRMIDERYAEVDSLSKGERLKVNRGRGVLFFHPFFPRVYINIYIYIYIHSDLSSEHALGLCASKDFPQIRCSSVVINQLA